MRKIGISLFFFVFCSQNVITSKDYCKFAKETGNKVVMEKCEKGITSADIPPSYTCTVAEAQFKLTATCWPMTEKGEGIAFICR
jgi:hypothetical protein